MKFPKKPLTDPSDRPKRRLLSTKRPNKTPVKKCYAKQTIWTFKYTNRLRPPTRNHSIPPNEPNWPAQSQSVPPKRASNPVHRLQTRPERNCDIIIKSLPWKVVLRKLFQRQPSNSPRCWIGWIRLKSAVKCSLTQIEDPLRSSSTTVDLRVKLQWIYFWDTSQRSTTTIHSLWTSISTSNLAWVPLKTRTTKCTHTCPFISKKESAASKETTKIRTSARPNAPNPKLNRLLIWSQSTQRSQLRCRRVRSTILTPLTVKRSIGRCWIRARSEKRIFQKTRPKVLQKILPTKFR